MDTLGLLFALKQVEERIARDGLNDDTLFSCLLVLLSFLHLFLSWVLTFLPVDSCANHFDSLVSIVVSKCFEADCRVSEEFVLTKSHSDAQLWLWDLDLGAVEFGEFLKDRAIFVSDNGLEHGVVLDGLSPVIGNSWGGLEVSDVGGSVSLLFLLICLLLFLGLDDAGH